MKKALKKIFTGLFTGLDKGLFYWVFVLMSGVAVWVVVSVLLRYIFNIVFNWTEELIIFLFIATTYFGSILGVKEDEHIKISLLKDKLPPKIKIVFEVLIACINIIVVIASAYLSRTWIEKAGNPLTPGLKIPFGTIYTMVPVAFILIALYEVREIVLKISSFGKSIK